ncbi:MAG TPA: sulfite oxidase-like oxidoreductase [Nitriliruptorales bacterium]|nr:sulfite oxidase-like oxidoreductase [Nitriliruptorales bacterium]
MPGPGDPASEVRRLLERADELIKYASNRPDPAAGYRTAGDVLRQAAALIGGIADPTQHDELLVQVGRRSDDLDRLMRVEARGGQPVRGEPRPRTGRLPQPGPATLHPSGRTGADRLPPSQRLVTSWPVLHVGRIPRVDLTTWRLTCTGLVAGHRAQWTWEEFRRLPAVRVTADLHCVTGWSRLDNRWEGVRFRDVADAAGVLPAATHAIVYGANAYSANIDLPSLAADDVLFAWGHDGGPLTPEHGGPLRLVVPSRYAWKSVKWVESVRFIDRDVPGFWEERGYHNVADPFLEQRYA